MESLKKIISAVAPFLGNMIAGPLGGAAAAELSKFFLGREDGTEQDIIDAVSRATPEQFIELKKIDNDYKKRMLEVGIDEKKIAAADRSSARRREMKLNDYTPSVLAIVLTLGFFSILLYILLNGIHESAESTINLLLGSLGTAWISMIAYYFGSSAGSQQKNGMLLKDVK